jgi:hypothetical protein
MVTDYAVSCFHSEGRQGKDENTTKLLLCRIFVYLPGAPHNGSTTKWSFRSVLCFHHDRKKYDMALISHHSYAKRNNSITFLRVSRNLYMCHRKEVISLWRFQEQNNDNFTIFHHKPIFRARGNGFIVFDLSRQEIIKKPMACFWISNDLYTFCIRASFL